MIKNVFNSLFKSKNEKYLNQLKKELPKIQEFYQKFNQFNDEEILKYSNELKEKYKTELAKEKNKEKQFLESEKILKKILPEAFALIKEVIKREFKIELYDVQLLGGMILHFGNIAEMKTGEGKTYTAMLPTYLNALTGKQVHIVTVNEYLAQRDAEIVSPVFKKLGISVGCNVANNSFLKKQEYEKNVVYGTSSNFGFDYLRDNSVYNYEDKLIKEKYFAIVDEVDSVLIDEARTPLIISSENEINEEDFNIFLTAREIIKDFEVGEIIEKNETPLVKEVIEKGDFKLDLKSKKVIFTEQGLDKITSFLIQKNIISDETQLYSIDNLKLFNLIQTAANAEFSYAKNKDYIIKDGRIMIIDEMTGRIQEDRQWSDGLHQAIEMKEGVKLSRQSHTVATTTLQHYFNKYEKISGMTGTAETEASEFFYVYGLETLVVPTNKKVKRIDHQDRVFITKEKRDKEFIELIKKEHEKGRPILIGTNSVKDNEFYSKLLTENNLPHEVLNAKNHLREAQIIAKAGVKNSITLATNMAGRGTDIILGGNSNKEKEQLMSNIFHSNHYISCELEKIEKADLERYLEIIDKNGLLVVSLGRNESRRVDNQLRGRSGRQGDIGESIFLISLDDDIFKPFGIEKVKNMALAIDKTGETEITGALFTKQISNIQRKIEEFHFENRKRIMQFSEPLDKQTDVVYEYRDEILKTKNKKDFILKMEEILENEIKIILDDFIPLNSFEEFWNVEELKNFLILNNIDFDIKNYLSKKENINTEEIKKEILEKFKALSANIKQKFNEEELGLIIKQIMLNQVDKNWLEHLENMEYLRSSMNLKGYSGKDPKEIFKKESFELFENLFLKIRKDIVDDFLKLNEVRV